MTYWRPKYCGYILYLQYKQYRTLSTTTRQYTASNRSTRTIEPLITKSDSSLRIWSTSVIYEYLVRTKIRLLIVIYEDSTRATSIICIHTRVRYEVPGTRYMFISSCRTAVMQGPAHRLPTLLSYTTVVYYTVPATDTSQLAPIRSIPKSSSSANNAEPYLWIS